MAHRSGPASISPFPTPAAYADADADALLHATRLLAAGNLFLKWHPTTPSLSPAPFYFWVDATAAVPPASNTRAASAPVKLPSSGTGAPWPVQDMCLLRGYCARNNHVFTPPPTCIAHPGTLLSHDYWTVYDSPSDLTFVCYTILVITTSCKGQGAPPPLR